MNCSKLLRHVGGVILVIAMVGCTSTVTPVKLPTPAQAPTKPPSPTETITKINNFEECVAQGNAIQNSYPRQCINETGEVFKEPLGEGITFAKIFGGKGRDIPYSIILTNDGGHLITGATNSYQCLILKLDESNDKEWETDLGQELRERFQFTNAWFHCDIAVQAFNGEYAIMGIGINKLMSKRFLISLDSQGNLISAETIGDRQGKIARFDKEGNLIWLNSFGIGGVVIETSDHSYAIVGNFPGGSPDSGTHIIKADENGVFVWEKNLCLDQEIVQKWEVDIACSDNNLWDVIQSQDGGYALTGGFSNGIWFIKTDVDGNVEWLKSYVPGPGNVGHAILQTPDGGFLLAGQKLMDQSYQDGILIKIDSTGNLQWQKTFGGSQHDRFMQLAQNPNGDIIVIGETKSFGEGEEDIWLLGIDSTILK